MLAWPLRATDRPALAVAMRAAVGLLVIAYAVFGLALLGVATPFAMWLLLVVLTALGAHDLWRRPRPIPRNPDEPRSADGEGSPATIGRIERTPASVAAAAAVAAWGGWIVATAHLPPTAIDELIYHLEIPRRVLATGSLPALTDNIFAYFPLGADMLFVYGLGVGGEPAARLMHALATVLIGMGIFGVVRPYVSRSMALLGATLFATAPTVMVISAWAYVDITFTLFGFLALVAAVRAIELTAGGAPRGAVVAWAAVSGILAGGAWATKYTGLQLTLLLVLVVLLEHLRARRQTVPWAAIVLVVVAGAVASPWMLRNLAVTGWPLFPFALAGGQLSSGFNWDAERAQLLLSWFAQFGSTPDRTLLERLAAVPSVFVTARFGDLTRFDGFVGPVFLLAPLGLIGRARSRTTVLYAAFGVAFLGYWAMTTTQVRFVLPALPVAAVLVVIGLAEADRRWLTGIVWVAAGVGVAIGVGEVRKLEPWSYWSGAIDRDEYLERRVAGLPLYREAERHLGPGDRVYLVNMRNFGYLLDLDPAGIDQPERGGWRADYVFQYTSLLRALERSRDVDQLAGELAAMGVTHVMIDEGMTLTAEALAPRERALLSAFLRESATLLARNPLEPRQSLWGIDAGAGPRREGDP